MQTARLSDGMRRHIRREKASIRRTLGQGAEAETRIREFLHKIFSERKEAKKVIEIDTGAKDLPPPAKAPAAKKKKAK